MAEVDKVKIEITAEASRALDEIKRMVGGLQGLASMAGVVGVAYLGGRAILSSFVETLNRVTEEASRQEQAEMGLTIALRNAGTGAVGTVKDLTEYATTLQRLTGIESTQIIEAEKTLSTFGLNTEAIKRATRATLDFATVQRVDLHTAAMLIGKAFQGQTETLARLGIKIDENLDKNQKFDAVIRQLEGRFSEFAEMMGSTFAGSQKKAAAAINDIYKEFGLLIIQSPLVKGGLDAVTNSAIVMVDEMKRSREAGESLGKTFDNLIDKALAYSIISGKGFMSKNIESFAEDFKAEGRSFTDFVTTLTTTIKEFTSTGMLPDDMIAKWKEFAESAPVLRSFVAGIEVIPNAIRGTSEALKEIEIKTQMAGLKVLMQSTFDPALLEIFENRLKILQDKFVALTLPTFKAILPEISKPREIKPQVDLKAMNDFESKILSIQDQLGLLSEKAKIELQFKTLTKGIPEGLDISAQKDALATISSLRDEALKQLSEKESATEFELPEFKMPPISVPELMGPLTIPSDMLSPMLSAEIEFNKDVEALNLERVKSQIDNITKIQTIDELEKIRRLTSLRDLHVQGTAEEKAYSDAIENITAGRSARELVLLKEQLRQETGLREAQLAAHVGMLSAEEAATIASYETRRALIDIENQYLIASQTSAGQMASVAFAEAGTQGVEQFTQSLGRAAMFSDNLGMAITNIGKNMGAMILQTASQWLIMAAIGKLIALMGLKTQTIVGAGVAAAWTPAALLRTVAEMGPILGMPAFESILASIPIYQARVGTMTAAGGATMGAAAISMAEGGVMGRDGLVLAHKGEIFSPEIKMIEIFQGVLKSERRGITFNDGAVTVHVNNPLPSAITADELISIMNEAFESVIV